MTNQTTYTWNQLNQALMTMNYSPKRILNVLMSLDRMVGVKTKIYSWETINQALMTIWRAPKPILDVMCALKKV